MSDYKLSDEQFKQMRSDARSDPRCEQELWYVLMARAIEAAVSEPLLARIAELELERDEMAQLAGNGADELIRASETISKYERELAGVRKDAEIVGTVIIYETKDFQTKWTFLPDKAAWEIESDHRARDRGATRCFDVHAAIDAALPPSEKLE